MKEYNFPNIFHNIIGEIIPEYVLDHMNRPDLARQIKSRNGSHQGSIKFSSESDDHSVQFGSFGPKIKKKKIFTRSKQFSNTNFLLSSRQQSQFDKETIKSQQTPQLKTFLRKKQSNLTEMTPSKHTDRAPQSQTISQQSEVTIEASMTDIEAEQLLQKQKQRKNKRALFRMRTSIDRPVELAGIAEEGEEDLLQTMMRKSDKNMVIANKGSKMSMEHTSPFISERQGQISKLSIQRQQSLRKTSLAGKINANLTFKQNLERKNVKKRTVVFANSKQNSGSSIPFVRGASRKGTIYSNVSRSSKKSNKTRFNLNNKLTRFKLDQNFQNISSLKTISIGTGKSVVSIKVQQSEQGRQGSYHRRQKSLRSNQSILKTERNLMFKRTLNRTRTAKIIKNKQILNIDKKFKSQKSVKYAPQSSSNLSRKDKALVLKRRKKSKPPSNGSQKKFKVKKAYVSRPSILRKDSHFQYSQASINRLLTVQECTSFSDLISRKKGSRPLNKTALRQTVQQDNVYDQLNDFLRFFHDKENTETERQIKRTFNKPIVLADETKMRQVGCNKQSFDKQNLCIDMGIKLIKKMNRLAQKKY